MKLIHRTKILLSILQELGGNLSYFQMQQLLFLYCREYVKRDEYYEFIPRANAPYSVQAQEDKQSLIHKKLLEKSDDWILKETSKRFAIDLDFFEKIAIQDLKIKWLPEEDEALSKHITQNYPQFSHKHESNADDEIVFYTIGYEGISPEAYINLLIDSKVRLLVDVRKNAFSQKYGFSKAELASILPSVGIEYMHMPELGIDSEKRQSLNSDKDYEILFNEYENITLAKQHHKLAELQGLLEQNRRIAITCFEADPHHCHRSRVAKALKSQPNFAYKIEHLKSCRH